jgi:lipid A 3-O-deacylase
MRRALLSLLLAPALFTARPAGAGDWLLGAGISYYSRTGAPNAAMVSLEWQTSPPWHLGRWRIGPAAAANWDKRHNLWAGIGLAARRDFGRWFVELGEMPGIFHNSRPITDLGGPIEFRSLIGIGYRIGAATSLSLAFDHRSNAGLYKQNPGANSVSLRLARRF